jgi:hypothetical protein
MLALSVRQPFAELILRGIKTVEYRSRATRIVGERFYLYASKTKWPVVRGQWPVKGADNVVVPGEDGELPAWMIELAEQVGMIEPGAIAGLPVGVIVGSAVIERVSHVEGLPGTLGQAMYRWHLADVRRARTLRAPEGRPQPVWFRAFG